MISQTLNEERKLGRWSGNPLPCMQLVVRMEAGNEVETACTRNVILRRASFKAAARSCIPVRCVDNQTAHNIAVMQIFGACIAAVLLLFVSISAARELQQSSSATASATATASTTPVTPVVIAQINPWSLGRTCVFLSFTSLCRSAVFSRAGQCWCTSEITCVASGTEESSRLLS